jgi:hypothetical protein
MDQFRNAIFAAKAIQIDIDKHLGPPEEGRKAVSQPVVLMALVRGTRGYIEKIANQANGAYHSGWYDASAVMLRRLLETLIIEAFEENGIAHKIRNTAGNYFYLGDLIAATLAEKSFTLGRNARAALPKLKDLGDKSAHDRRYNAMRGDLEPHLSNLRAVVEELLYIAKLKK